MQRPGYDADIFVPLVRRLGAQFLVRQVHTRQKLKEKSP
jgi:hypothetical protein